MQRNKELPENDLKEHRDDKYYHLFHPPNIFTCGRKSNNNKFFLNPMNEERH